MGLRYQVQGTTLWGVVKRMDTVGAMPTTSWNIDEVPCPNIGIYAEAT